MVFSYFIDTSTVLNNMLFVPLLSLTPWSGLFKNCGPVGFLNKMRLLPRRSMIREGERLNLPVHQVVEWSVVFFQAGDWSMDAKILGLPDWVVDEPNWQEKQMKSLKLSIRHSCQEVVISGQAVAVLEQKVMRLILISWVSLKVKGHEELKWFMQWTVLSEWSEWFSSRLLLSFKSYLGNHETLKVSITYGRQPSLGWFRRSHFNDSGFGA